MPPSMPDIHIAVLGDASVDYAIDMPPGPSADEKVIPVSSRRLLGGTGANAAAVIQSLGGTATLHAVVGNDPEGIWVLQQLREKGLDTSHVATREGATSFVTILMRGQDREVIVDIGVGMDLAPVAIQAMAGIDLAYVSYSPAAVIELVAGGLGPITVVGFEAWMVEDSTFREALSSCRLLITNKIGWEALRACGENPRVQTIQTLGSDGAALHHPDGSVDRFPAHAVIAVDATGAGDCFAGTLCHYLAVGFSLPHSIRQAIIAAALSTTAPGAQGWLQQRGPTMN